jgi:hypothetical protein
VDDRIWDRGFLYQLLLRELRAEVSANGVLGIGLPPVGQTVGSDDRQRHMMPHASGGVVLEKIARRRREEVRRRRFFKGG